MNEKNKLNHTLSRVKKFLKNPSEERFSKVLDLAIDTIHNDLHCEHCLQEDFGYCNLRHTNISKYEACLKYCFPAVIETIENKLKKFKKVFTNPPACGIIKM